MTAKAQANRADARKDERLAEFIRAAGFMSLASWAKAAGVSVRALYVRRYTGRLTGKITIGKLLSVARVPLDGSSLRDALARVEPEAK